MDNQTANLIQASVQMERSRCIGIVLREAVWLSQVAKGQPVDEQAKISREVAVLLDIADAMKRPD